MKRIKVQDRTVNKKASTGPYDRPHPYRDSDYADNDLGDSDELGDYAENAVLTDGTEVFDEALMSEEDFREANREARRESGGNLYWSWSSGMYNRERPSLDEFAKRKIERMKRIARLKRLSKEEDPKRVSDLVDPNKVRDKSQIGGIVRKLMKDKMGANPDIIPSKDILPESRLRQRRLAKIRDIMKIKSLENNYELRDKKMNRATRELRLAKIKRNIENRSKMNRLSDLDFMVDRVESEIDNTEKVLESIESEIPSLESSVESMSDLTAKRKLNREVYALENKLKSFKRLALRLKKQAEDFKSSPDSFTRKDMGDFKDRSKVLSTETDNMNKSVDTMKKTFPEKKEEPKKENDDFKKTEDKKEDPSKKSMDLSDEEKKIIDLVRKDKEVKDIIMELVEDKKGEPKKEEKKEEPKKDFPPKKEEEKEDKFARLDHKADVTEQYQSAYPYDKNPQEIVTKKQKLPTDPDPVDMQVQYKSSEPDKYYEKETGPGEDQREECFDRNRKGLGNEVDKKRSIGLEAKTKKIELLLDQMVSKNMISNEAQYNKQFGELIGMSNEDVDSFEKTILGLGGKFGSRKVSKIENEGIKRPIMLTGEAKGDILDKLAGLSWTNEKEEAKKKADEIPE